MLTFFVLVKNQARIFFTHRPLLFFSKENNQWGCFLKREKKRRKREEKGGKREEKKRGKREEKE